MHCHTRRGRNSAVVRALVWIRVRLLFALNRRSDAFDLRIRKSTRRVLVVNLVILLYSLLSGGSLSAS